MTNDKSLMFPIGTDTIDATTPQTLATSIQALETDHTKLRSAAVTGAQAQRMALQNKAIQEALLRATITDMKQGIPMDVVIVLDTTQSMEGEIDGVIRALTAFLETTSELKGLRPSEMGRWMVKLRVALVIFKDSLANPTDTVKVYDFMEPDRAIEILNSVEATGGGRRGVHNRKLYGEDSLTALWAALDLDSDLQTLEERDKRTIDYRPEAFGVGIGQRRSEMPRLSFPDQSGHKTVFLLITDDTYHPEDNDAFGPYVQDKILTLARHGCEFHFFLHPKDCPCASFRGCYCHSQWEKFLTGQDGVIVHNLMAIQTDENGIKRELLGDDNDLVLDSGIVGTKLRLTLEEKVSDLKLLPAVSGAQQGGA